MTTGKTSPAKGPKITSAADMLQDLWVKALPQMTGAELAAYASSMSLVHVKLTSLQLVTEQMTEQIMDQEDASSPMMASELLNPLFELASQLDTLAAMAFISSEAASMQPGQLRSTPVADHGAR